MSGYTTTLRTGAANPHPEPISGTSYSAVELMPGDQSVMLLDQRRLPAGERYEFYKQAGDVAEAIRTMVVRGAPAIGIAAAYAMVLAAGAAADARDFGPRMRAAGDALRATRPTAVNLAHAVTVMLRVTEEVLGATPEERKSRLAEAARAYHRAEVLACQKMGDIGARRMPDAGVVLTHCNAGALATGGFGSALGVIRAARKSGKNIRVIACETRPLLQGARLTAWELMKDHVPVTLVTDSMVAQLMRKGEIQACIVGADRIARNGDVANKIGTYGVACLAKMHGVPFDVAAPWSTIDLACEDGSKIPIEERDEREITHLGVWREPLEPAFAVAPDAVKVHNPAFDVTPASLIRAIYTERGEVSPVSADALRVLG